MKQHGQDRRSQRTRRLVTSAMMELLAEMEYDRITVQAILDRADIGRSTFYSHFADKSEVVDSIAAEIFETFGGTPSPGASPAEVIPALHLFRHAAERQQSLRAMLGSATGELFWATSQAALARAIEGSLGAGHSRAARPQVPTPVLSHYLAGAFIGMLKWWLRAKLPHSPERMAAMFQQLAATAVEAG